MNHTGGKISEINSKLKAKVVSLEVELMKHKKELSKCKILENHLAKKLAKCESELGNMHENRNIINMGDLRGTEDQAEQNLMTFDAKIHLTGVSSKAFLTDVLDYSDTNKTSMRKSDSNNNINNNPRSQSNNRRRRRGKDQKNDSNSSKKSRDSNKAIFKTGSSSNRVPKLRISPNQKKRPRDHSENRRSASKSLERFKQEIDPEIKTYIKRLKRNLTKAVKLKNVWKFKFNELKDKLYEQANLLTDEVNGVRTRIEVEVAQFMKDYKKILMSFIERKKKVRSPSYTFL